MLGAAVTTLSQSKLQEKGARRLRLLSGLGSGVRSHIQAPMARRLKISLAPLAQSSHPVRFLLSGTVKSVFVISSKFSAPGCKNHKDYAPDFLAYLLLSQAI
jgi:hypothetical protein